MPFIILTVYCTQTSEEFLESVEDTALEILFADIVYFPLYPLSPSLRLPLFSSYAFLFFLFQGSLLFVEFRLPGRKFSLLLFHLELELYLFESGIIVDRRIVP